MATEVILIRGEMVGQGKRPDLDGDSSDFHFNYAYFDQQTGEVWGQRVIQGTISPWIFTPGETGFPDLLLPYEIRQLTPPAGILLYICNYLLEQYEQSKSNSADEGRDNPYIAKAISDTSAEDSLNGGDGNGEDTCHSHAD